jgi:hypothetical protein
LSAKKLVVDANVEVEKVEAR